MAGRGRTSGGPGPAGRRLAALAAALLSAVLLCATAGSSAAQAQEPEPFSDWNPDYIGFPSDTPERPRADCARGSNGCVDRTLGEMWRRFHTEFGVCDHNNLFSLTYLRVTEAIAAAMEDGFYPDMGWINRQDAIFARMYFLAYDNWRAGRLELVPEAWRIAFGAGDDRSVEGIGNLLLSMNAHINRDFPFILYHAGLVNPDGSSKKAEHDAGNDLLRKLYRPMLDELAERFDSSIDNYDLPGTADDEGLFQILVGWRETAWQNAQRLAAAGSDAERRQVGDSIEQYAVAQAETIFAGSAYGPGEDSAARDAQCAKHGGQRPGYKRGADVAKPKRRALLSGSRLQVPLKCPRGPGPCIGRVSISLPGDRTPGRRFAIPLGDRAQVGFSLREPQLRTLHRAAEAGRRIRVRVRSKLEPGVVARRHGRLRLRLG